MDFISHFGLSFGVLTIPFIFVGIILLIKIIRDIANIVIIVPEQCEAIIERLGKYNRTLRVGVYFLIPFLERKKVVKWTRVEEERSYNNQSINRTVTYSIHNIPTNEQLFDFPEYNVITSDNLEIIVNGMLFYRIVDSKKAVYQISDLYLSFHKLIETSLRNSVTKLGLLEVIRKKGDIEKQVMNDLRFINKNWGIEITKLDIQDVKPPREFKKSNQKIWQNKQALEVQIEREEQERKRKVQEAETRNKLQELDYKRLIQKAKHEKTIKELKADSEYFEKQKEVNFLQSLMKLGLNQKYLECVKYTEAWKEVAKLNPNSTFIIPYESSKFFGSGMNVLTPSPDKKITE